VPVVQSPLISTVDSPLHSALPSSPTATILVGPITVRRVVREAFA